MSYALGVVIQVESADVVNRIRRHGARVILYPRNIFSPTFFMACQLHIYVLLVNSLLSSIVIL